MKQILLLAFFNLTLLAQPHSVFAQINSADSLALVDLYNTTNGPGWFNHSNWLTSAPMTTWYGLLSDLDPTKIDGIALQNNHLVGTIPTSIGNLTSGSLYIDLSNNLLTGAIPSSMATLPTYNTFLKLGHNQLSGAVPQFTIDQGVYLDISYNEYTFATLEPFAAWHNQSGGVGLFVDSIQDDLPLIQNGNVISIAAGGTLSNNTYTWYLNGTVIATNTGDSTFMTSGSGTYSVSVTNPAVPLTLYSIQNTDIQDSLALIDFYNSTSGSAWVKNTNWATSVPVSSWANVVTRFGRVYQLFLNNNNLVGTIPASFGNLDGATIINFSSNQISGALPTSFDNLKSLQQIILTDNQLTGSIPTELGNDSNLNTIYLDGNQLTGNIPTSIGNLSNLVGLFLSGNQLSGGIPAECGKLTNLMNILLDGNQLTDTIPSTLGNMTNLWDFIVNNNQLTGHIPQSFGRLKNLKVLQINDNKLSGAIPDSICYESSLQDFNVYDNQLTGTLPDSMSLLTNLFKIDVHNNNLSGNINDNLSSLSNLYDLNISGNQYNFSAVPVAVPSLATFTYAPQQNIPLTRVQANLSVSAGGNSTISVYTLFKNGDSIATQIGDSSFSILGLGNYNIVTTNTAAPLLTLYSDTLRLGLVLPDSSITTTQSIFADTVTNLESNIFLFASLTPTPGTNALFGSVTALETIDSSVQTYNGAPYVKRHYDITPAANASNAQAIITLYFTQADFDAYNSYVTAGNVGVPLLPTGGVDNGNVIITQYHGSFTGTSSPGNYSQGSQVIRPAVAWDSVDQWWTVTFSVDGFSGFFLGSSSNPLPLTLLQFTGVPQNYEVNLEWQTTDEVNTRQFIVERSPNGSSFATIGIVAAKNASGQNRYGFMDTHPYNGNNFYRLKMQDLGGNFTYSNIVEVAMSALPAVCVVYPNPATSSTSLFFNATAAANYDVQISDFRGNVLSRISGTASVGLNKVDIDVHGLAPGMYTVVLTDTEHGRQSISLLKE